MTLTLLRKIYRAVEIHVFQETTQHIGREGGREGGRRKRELNQPFREIIYHEYTHTHAFHSY